MTEPQATAPMPVPDRQSADAPASPTAGLVTYYQPFYNLNTGRMQGFKALARLHEGSSDVPRTPGQFFAAAEAAEQMPEIDEAIIEESLAQTARWHREMGRPELIISINVSGQTVRGRVFAAAVAASVARHRVPGDRVLLDLTTDTFRSLLADGADALAAITSLQQREITFCLDSFTADDLALLPRAAEVPVDIVKLHPRLVAANDERLAETAKAVQAAGLPVVAAGVETREQLVRVADLGFEWAQGFYLGAPVSAAEALAHPEALTDL